MKFINTSAVIAILLFQTAAANAVTVYQQPLFWNRNGKDVGSSFTSSSDGPPTDFRTYDNFTLGSDATINKVTWYGIYLDSLTLEDRPSDTTDWVVRFAGARYIERTADYVLAAVVESADKAGQ